MNPDSGECEREEAISAFAASMECTEEEAARRLLGGDSIRVEGTTEQVAELSRKIKQSRASDLKHLAEMRRDFEKKHRRQRT